MPSPARHRRRIAGTSFFLFCLALFLTAYSARNPELSRGGSFVVAEVLAPFQGLASGTQGSFSSIWNGYIALIGVEEENQTIKSRLAVLERENSRLMEMVSEISRLRGLLKASDEYGIEGVEAQVVAYDPSNWEQSITVSAGSDQGVKTGMAVAGAEGVVGQVISVSSGSARVLLITDHASGVDAIVQSTRARGVVEGAGGTRCDLSFLMSESPVKRGDRIITSGMDGVYPKGLLIGVVSAVSEHLTGMMQNIEVTPSVEFAKLESVLIILKAHEPEVVPTVAESSAVLSATPKPENKQ